MRFTIDSNILVYSLDRDTPAKHEVASRIMLRAPFLDSFLTIQAIGEFIAVFRRKFPEQLSSALMLAERWAAMTTVVASSPDHLFAAASQSVKHDMQFWDCVIWQTASANRAAVLLSEDMHDGFAHAGLSVFNPFNPANEARLQSLLADA